MLGWGTGFSVAGLAEAGVKNSPPGIATTANTGDTAKKIFILLFLVSSFFVVVSPWRSWRLGES